jgi:hypothetical protein
MTKGARARFRGAFEPPDDISIGNECGNRFGFGAPVRDAELLEQIRDVVFRVRPASDAVGGIEHVMFGLSSSTTTR